MGVAGSTIRSWPVMPRWTTSTRPCSRPTSSSGSGCRTMVGKRRSQPRMVRPTRCGRRSVAMVSTSGSSGKSVADHRELFHVRPVGAEPGLDLDPRLELIGPGHDPRHGLREAVDLAFGDLEEQLVVHLQEHAAFYVIGLDLAVEPDHCDLDDVRGE